MMKEFLQEFPWSDRELAMGRPQNWLWHFRVKVPRSDLWPLLSDTSRFNRLMDLPEMKFVERDGILYGSSKNAGMRMEWVEIPWSWDAERSMTNVREFSRGPAHILRAVYTLDPAEGGASTDVRIFFGWIPRFWGRPILFFAEAALRGNYEKALAAIEEQYAKRLRQGPLELPPTVLSESAQTRLAEIQNRLLKEKAPADLLVRLIHYISTADDLDLYRIRVLALADEWKVMPVDLIRLCLLASRAGLLTISWDVICPHCRGVRQELNSLGDIPARASCDVCDIEFENGSEESIEITFHVHPSVREVPRVFYCSAEPAKKSHIKIQQRLLPGSSRNLDVTLSPGKYRLRIRGQAADGRLLVEPAGRAEHLVWRPGAALPPVATGTKSRIVMENPTEEVQTFTIEESQWQPFALKPAALFNIQEYHDFFSQESLSPDLQLEIGEQTILFTDMVGSTRFYAESGDSRAFAAVKKHFEEVYSAVRENRGAVIKTIGDAVMASFPDPKNALEAAVALQKIFGRDRSDSPVRLRVSIHSGQCIAVNLNSGIDYFGTTVNVAAKIQALAGPCQIVFTDQFFQKPGVREGVERTGRKVHSQAFDVTGLAETLQTHRIEI